MRLTWGVCREERSLLHRRYLFPWSRRLHSPRSLRSARGVRARHVPVVSDASIRVSSHMVTDELDVNGKCSLGEAVIAANTACAAGNGAATIRLPCVTYGLDLRASSRDDGRSGDLDTTAPLSIVGAGRVAVPLIVSDATDRVISRSRSTPDRPIGNASWGRPAWSTRTPTFRSGRGGGRVARCVTPP